MRTKTLTLFYVIPLLLMSLVAHAAEIDDIRTAIAAKHAKWTAIATPLHKMDPSLRRMRASLVLPEAAPPAVSATQTTLSQPLSAPGAGLDWRSFGGTNYVTPAKDQMDCGSCWAFSTTGALESYTLIHGAYSTGLDLSEQIMISCSGAGSCNGGTIDGAASFIQQTGLPVDSKDPYIDANGSCAKAAANWQAATDKISAWEWINSGTVPDIPTVKNALYSYGPLVASMRVYSDFYSYGGGVYTYTSGPFEGNHAILLIGYADDATVPGGGYFIVKNSWGQSWGEGFNGQPGGYFKIAYGESAGPTQFAHNLLAYDTAVQTCSYAISSSGATLGSTSGSGSVGVITSGSCTWSARSSASWLSISGAAGRGNGSIAYAVTANTGSAARTATVAVIDAYANVVDSFTVTQNAPAPVSTFSLAGVVRVNSGTGTLLSGATVTLGSKSVTTDAAGSFLFSGLAAGKYALSVSKAGYLPYANSGLSVSSNQSVVITLPQVFTLSGTVTSGSVSGPALSGAVVSINGTAEVTTGTAGSFSITGIPAGTYSVSIAKAGFASYTNNALTVSSDQNIKAALAPITYTVSGTIRAGSSSGPALSGAAVTIGGQTVKTSSAGAYSLAGIAPGTSPMVITMDGYLPFAESLGVSSNQTVNIALAPSTSTVSGTVRFGSMTGPPLAGATVSLGSKSTTSGSDGSFSIPGLSAGSYTLTVSKPTYTSFTMTLLVATSIAGLDLPIIQINYQVSGVVTTAGSGGLLSGASVTIGTKSAVTTGAGSYTITGLIPGVYPMTVTKPGYLGYTNSALNVNGNLVLTTPLTPVSYTLSGTVRAGSSTGALLAGATVSVAGKTATTNSSGVYSITGIQAGSYAVGVTEAGYTGYANPAYPLSGTQALNVVLAAVLPPVSKK